MAKRYLGKRERSGKERRNNGASDDGLSPKAAVRPARQTAWRQLAQTSSEHSSDEHRRSAPTLPFGPPYGAFCTVSRADIWKGFFCIVCQPLIFLLMANMLLLSTTGHVTN